MPKCCYVFAEEKKVLKLHGLEILKVRFKNHPHLGVCLLSLSVEIVLSFLCLFLLCFCLFHHLVIFRVGSTWQILLGLIFRLGLIFGKTRYSSSSALPVCHMVRQIYRNAGHSHTSQLLTKVTSTWPCKKTWNANRTPVRRAPDKFLPSACESP